MFLFFLKFRKPIIFEFMMKHQISLYFTDKGGPIRHRQKVSSEMESCRTGSQGSKRRHPGPEYWPDGPRREARALPYRQGYGASSS